MSAGTLASAFFVALLFLQPAWHGLLPTPYGSRSALLALGATLPLLLPLRGVLKHDMRAMTLAGFLVLLYFVVGVMEAWSNPAQRWPALLQVALGTGYVAALGRFSQLLRRERRAR